MIVFEKVFKIYSLKGKNTFYALDNISFSIQKGEVFGLLGRSGSGKSTLAKILLGIESSSSGSIYIEGRKKTSLMPKKIQMVFQDPNSSLNPKMKIAQIIDEPLMIHRLRSRVDELLEKVHLPLDIKKRYPHEISGGQKQRVAIARALALNPDIFICDEPISSLDLSIQTQMIHLLQDLQKKLNLTILFIAHDPVMVHYFCDRIGVMDQGKMIEIQKADSLFQTPQKSYTKQLVTL